MLQQNDWRLNGQDSYLKNAQLVKVVFPEFWEQSKREKNAFYHKVWNSGRSYVKSFPKAAEYLTEERVPVLWHEHCEFCWEKFMTDIPITGYCTPDYYYWICEECYEDFKDSFGFRVVEPAGNR